MVKIRVVVLVTSLALLCHCAAPARWEAGPGSMEMPGTTVVGTAGLFGTQDDTLPQETEEPVEGQDTSPDDPESTEIDDMDSFFHERVIPADEFDLGPSPKPGKFRPPHQEAALLLGGAHWHELPDHTPRIDFPTSEGFGNLNRWGAALELSLHGRAAGDEQAGLWLGGRFGILEWWDRMSFNTVLPRGEVIDDEVTASVLYLVASGRADFELSSWLSAFAGGGGGGYWMSIDEDNNCCDTDTLADDFVFGGFASVGLDFRVGEDTILRLEQQAHYARFDTLDRFSPGHDSIHGPFYVTAIGLAGRF